MSPGTSIGRAHSRPRRVGVIELGEFALRFTGFSVTTGDRKASLEFYGAMGFAIQEDKRSGGRSCVDAINRHFDIDDADPDGNAVSVMSAS